WHQSDVMRDGKGLDRRKTQRGREVRCQNSITIQGIKARLVQPMRSDVRDRSGMMIRTPLNQVLGATKTQVVPTQITVVRAAARAKGIEQLVQREAGLVGRRDGHRTARRLRACDAGTERSADRCNYRAMAGIWIAPLC